MQETQRSTILGPHGEVFERVTEWEEYGTRPVIHSRRWVQVVEAHFHGPSELLDEAWEDILVSAMAAGTVAGIPAIAASPARALPVFEEAFFTCLASRWPKTAHRIRVGLDLRIVPEDEWRPG